jgi:hypothetical protein
MHTETGVVVHRVNRTVNRTVERMRLGSAIVSRWFQAASTGDVWGGYHARILETARNVHDDAFVPGLDRTPLDARLGHG